MNDLSVQFQGVSKKYRHFTLDNISFELPAGSIMGFIGANGAGKSTTIRILMGLVHQDKGAVRDAIEYVLRAQGSLERVIDEYIESRSLDPATKVQ